jgi:hypothetical protein
MEQGANEYTESYKAMSFWNQGEEVKSSTTNGLKCFQCLKMLRLE